MFYNFNDDGTATFVLDEQEQEVLFYLTMYWDTPAEVSETMATSNYPELQPAFQAFKGLPALLQANSQARHAPKGGAL